MFIVFAEKTYKFDRSSCTRSFEVCDDKSDIAIKTQHGRFSGSAFLNTSIWEFFQIFSETTDFFATLVRHFEICKFDFIFGISILENPYAGVSLSLLGNDHFFWKSRLPFPIRNFKLCKYDFIFGITILENSYTGVSSSFLWNGQFFRKSRPPFLMCHFEFCKFLFIFRIGILKNLFGRGSPNHPCGRRLVQWFEHIVSPDKDFFK